MSRQPISGTRIRILTGLPDPTSQLTRQNRFARLSFQLLKNAEQPNNVVPLTPEKPDAPTPQNDAATEASKQEDHGSPYLPHMYQCLPSIKGTDDSQAAMQQRINSALIQLHRGDAIIEHLAQRVAEFCQSPSILAGGTWEIRLALDPVILPDTALLLRLIAKQIHLRFESQSTSSYLLLIDRREQLEKRLSDTLKEKYELAIDIWKQ